MSAPILLDSSLYITALRTGKEATVLMRRWTSEGPVWLSSVVLEELYAGARPTDHRVLDRMERDFERAKRIVVPNLTDWTLTGKTLARIGAKHGFDAIAQSRLTNDVLIAMSAARLGITVLTANQRDFARISEFRQFRWEVRHTLTG